MRFAICCESSKAKIHTLTVNKTKKRRLWTHTGYSIWAYKLWCVSLSRTHRELNAPSMEQQQRCSPYTLSHTYTHRQRDGKGNMKKNLLLPQCNCIITWIRFLSPFGVLSFPLAHIDTTERPCSGAAQEPTHYILGPQTATSITNTHSLRYTHTLAHTNAHSRTPHQLHKRLHQKQNDKMNG